MARAAPASVRPAYRVRLSFLFFFFFFCLMETIRPKGIHAPSAPVAVPLDVLAGSLGAGCEGIDDDAVTALEWGGSVEGGLSTPKRAAMVDIYNGY